MAGDDIVFKNGTQLMCGIVGVLTLQSNQRDPVVVKRMMDQIAHRGPDDSGVYASGPVSLGFRRLSIIDLGCGHQPMVSSDERFAIVFNGEVYNFQELREELERDHHRRFLTRSDTEVALQAFEVWGTGSFVRFNGMFAIALWDASEQQLYLARDRAGKKPLFTYSTASTFLFASEVKALRVHPLFSAQPDLSRIASSVAYRYVPGQETLFTGVHALPAGHWAALDLESGFSLDPRPFWTNPACSSEPEGRALLPAAAVEDLRDKLTASVRRRMVADVPVGAFLSGGIDSSLIVALMASAGAQRLNTFSIGFDTGFSEHTYARSTAEKFGTTHHETIVNANDLLKEIPAVLWHRETPISEPSDIPLFMLSREARRHVTVVLSGEGSDELFGGYPKYLAEHYLSGFPANLLRGLAPTAEKLLPTTRGGSSPAAVALASISESDYYNSMARWFGAFGAHDRNKLFQANLSDRRYDIHSYARHLADQCPAVSRMTMMQLQDFAHWLPANLLLRSDRVTMAHSLELRCPFLDLELINFAFGRLPDNMKIRNGQGKWLVRKMAEDLLPRQITARKKWGFKVPVGEWFRGPLKSALMKVLLSPEATGRGYFHKAEIQRLITEHTQGDTNHSKQLWYLFQLELWHLMFVDETLRPGDDLLDT